MTYVIRIWGWQIQKRNLKSVMNWSKYTSLISEEMIYQKHLQQKKMGHSVTTTAEKLHFQSQSR